MLKIFMFSVLLASPVTFAFASTTQLNCNDGISDGGYQFIIQDFTTANPTVLIPTKSRAGTFLYEQQQLTHIGSEDGYNVFFNRLGIRTKMWLKLDGAAYAKFSFLQVGEGPVRVPNQGSLLCFEEEI